MQYKSLGRSGLKVSRLCLGTMNFGWVTDAADSLAVMDSALTSGINFWDTADVYNNGESEQMIGRWFTQGEGRREKIVLGTKVFISKTDWPNFGRLSALNIRRSCEHSLRRLKTDYIDIYQFHHIDRETPWEEIWQATERLVQEGKIIYAGSSNFAGWHIAQANEVARRRNFLGFVSEQSLYNLMERTVELEVVPACQSYGIGLITWSPLAGGLLAGSHKRAGQGRRAEGDMLLGHNRRESRIESTAGQLQMYDDFCAAMGESPADVALAWLLAQPAVTAPVTGPRTKDQLDSSLRALEIAITPEILLELDKIFPGPGGAAPEAYAW
jgi:aryl-alcohol dehydrogenase-like predicted oxidoreductase